MDIFHEIQQYAQAHERKCLHSVHQFVRAFGWSKEAEKALYQMLYAPMQRRQMEREAHGREEQPTTTVSRKDPPEPEPLYQTIGKCPNCEGWLVGTPLPDCESRASGRYFYKECAECDYYSEIFIKDKKFIEIEGGD